MTKSLAAAILGLIGSIYLHYERTLDWKIQSFFFSSGRWWVDENEAIKKLLFYQGPKALLVGLALIFLVAAVISFKRGSESWKSAVYVLACLAAVPIFIGLAKALTNEACPKELVAFGGQIALNGMRGQCFPGGHASGGYALVCLYWYFGEKRAALLPGFLFGTVLGFYQIFKGSHFISDTLVTAFFAWIFCELAWRMRESGLSLERVNSRES